MALAVSALAGPAYAQPGGASAIAEQLFNEGRELARANRWAEACPRFEASLRQDPALGTRLNLATCYEHVGSLARAWGLYRESAELAGRAGDAKRADYAQGHAAALEPRLARLAISAPVEPPAGFVVTWDGNPIDAGALGVALYADPGPHALAAWAPGFGAFTRTVTLVEGKAEALAVPELTAASGPASQLAKPPIGGHAGPPELVVVPSEDHVNPVPAKPVVAPSSTRRYVVISLGAAGAAATGVGLLFGAKARSAFGDAKALCGPSLSCSAGNQHDAQQLVDDARSSATISTVLVAAGGAAIVAGAVVFFTRPHVREQATAQIVPVAHAHGAGLAILGRF